MERTRELETEDLVYLAVNVFWEDQQFFLPKLPNGFVWRLAVNTDQPEMPEKESQMTVIDSEFILKPRSVAVFVGGPSFLTKCREMEKEKLMMSPHYKPNISRQIFFPVSVRKMLS